MTVSRTFPNVRVRRASPNHSSRRGAKIGLIVIHATAGHNRPGISDLVGLGEWFAVGSQRAGTPVSSHVAVDNEANSARYVSDADKAWHCAAYNSVSLGIEQIIPGDGREITADLYRETARWVARWSIMHGIPIRRGVVSGGRLVKTGVLRHSDLGAPGGNHDDPGRGYDEAHMLALAMFYRGKLLRR
jgi:hypothetical protein